jgi:hypothetical protein
MRLALLSRAAARPARYEVCPPHELPSFGTRLRDWFESRRDAQATQPGTDSAPFEARASRPSARLARAQRDFASELADLPESHSAAALAAIRRAASLHDLWHLRAQVFDIVARHHDQQQAAARLARLDRHFPTRSPRSGLVPFDTTTSFGALGR